MDYLVVVISVSVVLQLKAGVIMNIPSKPVLLPLTANPSKKGVRTYLVAFIFVSTPEKSLDVRARNELPCLRGLGQRE